MRLPGRYGRVVLLPAAPVQPPTGQTMSFLRWGNGGALTDPTSVPAREPSPARNSCKDKFLCPFSSLKKNLIRTQLARGCRHSLPDRTANLHRRPKQQGSGSHPAHIAACSLAYHIPSKRRRNNNLARKTTRTAARETTDSSLISHLLGDILLRRRHIFLVQIRQKPRSRQQGSLHQRVLCRNLCLRSLACRPPGSHPRLADATAQMISEETAYNRYVRNGQGGP